MGFDSSQIRHEDELLNTKTVYTRDKRLWNLTSTYNRVVPLSCFDVSVLQTYDFIFPSEPRASADPELRRAMFFNNFPIRKVFVAGYITEVERRDSAWTMVIADGSGAKVPVRFYPKGSSQEPRQFGFLEVIGHIRETPKSGRQIYGQVAKHYSVPPMGRVLDLFHEAYLVRREILEKGVNWEPLREQLIGQKASADISMVPSAGDMPIGVPGQRNDAQDAQDGEFLSFSRRSGSVLQDHIEYEVLTSIESTAGDAHAFEWTA